VDKEELSELLSLASQESETTFVHKNDNIYNTPIVWKQQMSLLMVSVLHPISAKIKKMPIFCGTLCTRNGLALGCPKDSSSANAKKMKMKCEMQIQSTKLGGKLVWVWTFFISTFWFWNLQK
jgi:hypothetical protein